jgi:Icc-related predicted phosphoesterase
LTSKHRLFFVTDIHGSDRCFRKFINAAKFYKAKSLILGGDITGKVMVPIVASSEGKKITWTANYMGEKKRFDKESKLIEFEKSLGECGIYSVRMSDREYEEIDSDRSKLDAVFEQAMKGSLMRWISLASERLKESQATCFISTGNDDSLVVDEVLASADSERIVFCEEKVIEVGGHEMLSLGTSNRTPWNSPREADEDMLSKKLDELADKMKHPENSIFSVHVPPAGSGIDSAPKLDSDFKPVLEGGLPVMIPAGSTAVKDSILKYGPILGLHGHIHESRGVFREGRTICLNPGSEYAQGILRGAIVDLEDSKVADYLLVSG